MPTATKAAPSSRRSAEAPTPSAEGRDPRIDAYLDTVPVFARPILDHLREAVHTQVPTVVETIKWGRPFFLLNGTIFCNMSAFTQHCSFGFWSSKMTQLLGADGIDGNGSSGSLGRITSLDDLPPKKVFAGYLRTAAKLVAEGEYGPGLMAEQTRRTVKAPLPVPPEFAAALATSKAAQANFDAYPPSCRREYIAWIASAKRPETRERRLLAALEMIAGNRRMNDQHR